jgi:two-component system, OmpR family, response regulator
MVAKTGSSPARNILLVEDEGEMCLLLNLILDDKDLKIEHVKTLSAADAFLQKRQPSLILLDNRLPDGYGLDFIGYLKTNYPTIKIILISGIDKAAGDCAQEAGADAFLSKPFTKTTLMQSVHALLN